MVSDQQFSADLQLSVSALFVYLGYSDHSYSARN
jgi:hypothetical protein